MSKIIAEYEGMKIPVTVTKIGNRTRTNQYNQDVIYREIRGLLNTSIDFDSGTIVDVYGKEFKVTYLDKSIRPASITLSENVWGV